MKQLLLLGAAAALVAPAMAETEWMTDLPAAQERAAAEGKAVLADFTGSDWCGWCIRLRKNVLDTPEFESYAADKFVLLEVDVPRNPDFDQDLLARNRELCDRYAIDGFPTVLVLTPQGQTVGGFVGGMPDLAAVSAPLDAGAENARAYAEAMAMEDGPEKAAALFKVYQNIPAGLRNKAATLRDAILTMDPEDATGIHAIEAARQQKAAMNAELRAAQDIPAMLAVVEKYLPEAAAENRASMLNLKAQLLLSAAETEEDVLAAKAVAQEAADCDPATAEESKAAIERAFADPAALLERARQYRERRGNK